MTISGLTVLILAEIKEVAKDMGAEQFLAMAHQKIPAFRIPNGDVPYAGYNRESDTPDVGQAVSAEMNVRHHFPYGYNVEPVYQAAKGK